jgi:hypothetical protein
MKIIMSRPVLDSTLTSERITQTNHMQEAHIEMLDTRTWDSSYLLINELPQESHAEHTVSNYAIQANLMRSLFI